MRRSLWIGMLLAVAISLAACNVDNAGGASGSTNATQAADANTGANPAGQNPAGAGQAAPTLSADATTAIQQFSRLTVGILYLQDNQAGSVTRDQATKLLTYYQDIQTNLQSARDAANNGTPMVGGPGGGPGGAPDANGTPQAGGPGGAPDANGTPQAGGPGGNGGGQGGGPGGGIGGGGFGSLALIDLATLQTDLTGIQSTLTADQLSVIDALTQDQLTATMQQHGSNMPGGQPGDGSQGGQQGTPDPNQMATMQAQGAPGGAGGRQGGGSALLEEVITVLTGIAAG